MFFLYIVNRAIDIYLIILFIRVVLSWIAPYSRNDFTNVVYAMTDPLLNRCRVVVPLGGAYIDLSVIIAWFGIKILRYLINYLFFMF